MWPILFLLTAEMCSVNCFLTSYLSTGILFGINGASYSRGCLIYCCTCSCIRWMISCSNSNIGSLIKSPFLSVSITSTFFSRTVFCLGTFLLHSLKTSSGFATDVWNYLSQILRFMVSKPVLSTLTLSRGSLPFGLFSFLVS